MPTGNGQPRIYDTALPSDWTPGNTLFTPLLVEELRARVELAGNQVINVDTEGSVLETDLKILLYFPTPLTAPEEAAADNQVLIHNGEAPPPADTVNEDVTQVAHGLVVGDVIRSEAGLWIKALADTLENSEAQGIVSTVADADNFTFISQGCIRGFTGLVQDSVYFLSDTVAGALTTTEPAISRPMLYAKNDVCGLVYPYRSATGGTSSGGDNSVFQPATLPAGGVADQILTKGSATDYDYNWQNAASALAEFQNFESLPEVNTTNNVYTQAHRFTTAALDGGDYIVFWSGDAGTDNNKQSKHRIQIDDVQTLSEVNWKVDPGENSDTGANKPFFAFSGSAVLTLTAGVHNFDFDYAAQSSDMAYFKRVRLHLWRVS